LSGTSQLSISGSYLVVDGLNFEGGGDNSLGYIIQFRGSDGDANNCRLTNTQIINYNPSDSTHQYHWVEIFGQDNRVDHCLFQGQNHAGVTLVVRLDDNGQAARHQIDYNAFLDRPEGDGNGFETIRIGTSARATTSAQVVVENNLFQNADGEIEIISNKSGDNVFRYNTFRSCAGTLTLRHGKAATVDGNFFLGEDKARSGGIRVVDSDHVIVNNYFADIDDRADAAISLVAGIDGGPVNGYEPVRDVDIHNNTIVDVGGAAVVFDWGFGDTDNGGTQDQLPENISIINNLIRSTSTSLFEGQEGSGWTWTDNIAFGASLGISGRTGLQTVDPVITVDANGLWRPGSTSPAIDGGTTLSAVTSDMDGQDRMGLYDIGADEASSAAIFVTPLTVNDVGPDWDIPVIEPPTGAFVALQAEAFASTLDPNGDGDTWQIVSDTQAHGDQAIEAPAGTRTNLTGSHDALALYDVTFSEAGTYTAYYRAVGYNGSSDSFYTPSGFGVDPSLFESTSNNGSYRWESSEVLTVSVVGVAQQLRIGRREGLTRIDAIVFHQTDGLSDQELDTLFNTPPIILGDVNLDGFVDFLDISPFIAVLSAGGNQAEADVNQDGVVDFLDISPFIALLSGS
ncbi:UNVERIFIED_CONTAM: hypothetical protein GTU68_054324, partial [Idotea baltica]|nr:hypothetical protein [Idotea baltica]